MDPQCVGTLPESSQASAPLWIDRAGTVGQSGCLTAMNYTRCLLLSMASILALVPFMESCGSGPGQAEGDGKGRSATQGLEAALSGCPRWVDCHAPELTDGGYNLVLYRRRTPFLMNMNGELQHSWPHVRVSGRAKLLPNGHLAVISDRGHFTEYDWDGRPIWEFRLSQEGHFLHHDFTRLRSGNSLLIVHQPASGTDYLLEVDRSGKEVWRWQSHESISEDLERTKARRNKTHMNSVQELPANRWFDMGLEEFRPGNILVSVRNLNALYVVARPSGEVVWRHYDGLDYQHEARMVPAGIPGAGSILLFNNGYHNIESYRSSAIVEVNPLEHSVVWRYRSPGFFSSTGGVQQALSNGNLLVTSSQGGRVFELTREGRIVWQWAPPFLPMRASRYPYDYCPQFASLGPPAETPVDRRDPELFIDADLYSFALTERIRRVEVHGKTVNLLTRGNRCQQLRLPEDARLSVGYGIVRRGRCSWEGGRPVRFGVSIRSSGTEESEELLQRTLGADNLPSREQDAAPVVLRQEKLSLARYARQTIDLCMTVASTWRGLPPPCFVWEAPKIHTAGRALERPFQDDAVDVGVQKHQMEQLEALGYVN